MSQALTLIQWSIFKTTRTIVPKSSDDIEPSNDKSDSEDESNGDTQPGDEVQMTFVVSHMI